MKKYLLTVLALGATMMMACNPDDSKGEGKEEPKADYNVTNATDGYLDAYGDYYGVGLNNFAIELDIIDEANDKITMVLVEYLLPLDSTTGLATLSPDPKWLENLYAGEVTPNTYFTGVDMDGVLYGSVYAEGILSTETISFVDAIVDGNLTISRSGDNYVVKGLLTLGGGKTLNVDYTGALEFGDYASGGGVSPLSVKGAKLGHAPRFFSSVLKK